MNNQEIQKLLKHSINNDKVLHSYMFIGSKLTAKEKIAKEFSKQILCLNEEMIPCEECKSCIEMINNNHPDFKVVELGDGDSSIKIEQIREMQEDVIKKPIVSEKKVYIIKDSDLMTIGAQNCLLKTLEEPPHYVTMILLVENENNILTTIKSRCTKIIFTEESDYEMTNEQQEIYKELERVFGNIKQYTLLDVLNKLDVVYKNEKNIDEVLDYINVILYKNIMNDRNIKDYIEMVEETKKRLKSNANFNMTIDNLLMNIWKK